MAESATVSKPNDTKTESSDAGAAIQLAREAIRNNQVVMLSKYIQIMPLEQLDVDTSNDFFSEFMDLCALENRGECMKVIFEAWSRIYPNTEKMPIFSKLFLIPVISVESILLVSKTYQIFTYNGVMDDLIAYDAAPYIPIACSRVIQVFGERTPETYDMLMKLAIDKNPAVAEFLAEKLHKVGKYAEVPSWVKDFREGDYTSPPLESQVLIPEWESFGFDIPPLNDLVDMLTLGMEDSGMTIDDKETAREVLRARLSIATHSEKVELLKPIMDLKIKEGQQTNDELFRVLGPVNPLVHASDEEMTYGGARMFIDATFDFDEETGYVEDWFEGFCNECDLQIRIRWHAVRMPRPHGGWRGAYCSWKCVREAVYSKNLNMEGTPQLLTDMLINAFEIQIGIIGIQDRIAGTPEQSAEISEEITSSITTIPQPDEEISETLAQAKELAEPDKVSSSEESRELIPSSEEHTGFSIASTISIPPGILSEET